MLGITILLATSLRLTLIAGIFNLGQIAFYGIGAYVLMELVTDLGISFWLGLPLAGIAAAIVALGLGYVTIRVKGLYFCMLSMAFVEFVRLTIIAIPFLGALNPRPIPPPNPIVIPYLLRVEFISKVPYYYLMFALVAIMLVLLYRIEKSQMGAILKSMTESEDLTRGIGVNIVRYKVLAFVICSFFASVAGAFWSSYATIISPESFEVWKSIMVFIVAVVGGLGSLWGPVIGAAFLTILPEVLRAIVPYELEPTFYAITLILIIYFVPPGLIGLPQVIQANMRKLYRRRVIEEK